MKEVIETIGDSHRAALSLIFMRGGSLESPVKMTPEEERSINLLSSNTPKITSSYNALEESLVLKECSDGNVYWKFKHPTIRDALASIISEDQELLDIYLSGAKPEELFTEITCGVDSIRGVSLIVPKSHFDKILSILEAYLERYKNCAFLLEFNLNPFLSNRCNFDFLKIFIDKFSYYPDLLTNFSSLEYDSKVNLLMKLSGFSLLDESTRKKAAEQIQKLVVEEAVPGFPNNFTELILRMDEHSAIVEKIKTRLLPNLTDIITETANSFDKDEDANDHFYDLIKAIGSYRDLLGINEDCDESSPEYLFKTYIDNALVLIDETVDELNQEPEIDEEREWLDSNSDSTEEPERSIFDDVDI